MAEYIERNKLIEDIDVAMNNTGMGRVVGETMKRYIKRLPAADVVEVVRCKDCRCAQIIQTQCGEKYFECKYFKSYVVENDFCSYGEREGTDHV